ncbi:alpha/beta hydrolase [Saccharothrix longispora]|uniref:alpha/beta hydrolase n=1 Tax=Saccharothrix longispora TaxID=33920 RepID=UPI0028FDA769|nr:alpha/beta hydrolase [Saccharothrix longispora]MDU0292208.1 alpha/beta hydrolase [Saccharothrix longispora]
MFKRCRTSICAGLYSSTSPWRTTPHRGGALLDEKFGDRSRLVSVDGSGHGVYVTGDNACALNTTTTFLVDGTLPERDISCT